MKHILLALATAAALAAPAGAQNLMSSKITKSMPVLKTGLTFNPQVGQHAMINANGIKPMATTAVTRSPKNLSYEVFGNELNLNNMGSAPLFKLSELQKAGFAVGYAQVFGRDVLNRFAGNKLGKIKFFPWLGVYSNAKMFVYDASTIDQVNGKVGEPLWSQDITIKGNTVNSVDCDYVIPAEGLKQGIVVGFYANVKAASNDNSKYKDYYNVVYYTDNTQAGSGGYIWGHNAQAEGFLGNISSYGFANALWCETEGDAGLRTEDVCAAAADQARGASGSTQSVLGQFINFGTDSIYSIDYTYENDGKTTSGTVKFREPVKYYCASQFHFDAPVNAAAGRYNNGKLIITKVNGKDDEYTTAQDNEYPYVNTVSLSEAYKRTPVIEEFTSTTCGWCPFGIVGLPKAVEAVNGKAVAIAVHADYDADSYGYDPLVSSSYENVVYRYASSFPSAFVNRESMTHAYTGIVEAVKEMAEKPCEASMTFNPKKTLQGIKMNTTLNFTIDAAEGEYGIAYVVTEDNVENVSQLNYFSYYYNEGTKKGYQQYVKWYNELPSDVKPLATEDYTTIEDGNNVSYWSNFTMNHVGCSIDDPTFATSEAAYNKLALPAIVKGQDVKHTYTMKNPTRTAGKDNYGNALQYTSEVPAVNNENLKYAALLIDLRSGKILTGCQAALGETVTSNDKADLTAGINDVKADAADVADITAADGAFTVKANGAVAQVYDAQGRLVSSATVNGEASLPTFGKGVFIIRVTKGGNTTSQKAIF